MNASPPSVNSTAPRYCVKPPEGRLVSELVMRDDVAESDWSLALGLVGDVVAGEQEAQRDQQAAGRDERDHVADAGEQDLADPGAPADVARGGGRGGGRSRVTLDAGGAGLAAAASASATILSGSLIARLTPDATTGLPANRCLSLTPTSVAKMTASASAMVAGDSGVLPDEPWVSTCNVAPAFLAAATRESAAM